MKSARNSVRWWRIPIWLLLIFAVGWFVWQTRTRTSYSAVCAKCLQRMHGLEVKCGGISISNEQKLERYRPAPDGGGGFILGSMPATDPKDYERITGQPCVHNFKRTGFCRYNNRGVGCGQFGEGMAFRARLEPLEAIYRTFDRIPDRDLGNASFAVLDRIFPPDATAKEAHQLSYDFDVTTKNIETMTLMLSIVESSEEWRTALKHFENGFQGEAPMISDAAFIELRIRSTNPLVRRGCATVVSNWNTKASPQLLATMLDDPDEGVSEKAGDRVFFSKQFELFGKLFRKHRPDSYRIDTMAEYDDSDFEKLFELDDPVVDDICFEAIAKDQRLQLLDQVVKRLNHHDSEAGRKAVERLIEGPTLGSGDDASRDPWEFIEAFDGNLDQAIERVRRGYSRSSDFWSLLKCMKTLAATHDPSHWMIVNRAYEQAANDGINEFHVSIMAKAMMELDPIQTKKYLIDEIKGESRHHLVSALAGMGLIASPDFSDAIVGFMENPPAASDNNPYPPRYYFKEGEPKKVLEYALHRCRGVQNWRLMRDANGKYIVNRE